MRAAIVTGVSRGLGEALAARCSRRGHRRRDRPDAEHRHRERAVPPRRLRPRASLMAAERCCRCCARSPETPPRGHADQQCGRGDAGRARSAASTPRRSRSAFATNVAAPLVMADLSAARSASPCRRRRIINVSSGAAQTAVAGSAAYCMSKAALEMLTRALVADHARDARSSASRCGPGSSRPGMQQFMRSHDPARFSERRPVPRLQGKRPAQGSGRRRARDRREARDRPGRERPSTSHGPRCWRAEHLLRGRSVDAGLDPHVRPVRWFLAHRVASRPGATIGTAPRRSWRVVGAGAALACALLRCRHRPTIRTGRSGWSCRSRPAAAPTTSRG